MTGLRPDGPHSPNYTRQVGGMFAEVVRVLNHATATDAGLAWPADAYGLLGSLAAGVAGLDQTVRQLADFLERQLRAGRLSVESGRHTGDPAAAVAAARGHLDAARGAAGQLAAAFDQAQQAVSFVAADTTDEDDR